MTISVNNPHLATMAGLKTKPDIGPATNMQELYKRGEAGDYWECGYLPGKALPENGAGFDTSLIGQKWGEICDNSPQGGSASIEPRPNPNTGGPTQWRVELDRFRVTLTRPLPTNNFTMWCTITCSDVGWNGFMALGGGPYIYNLPPQYNFQAGRPGTQGIVSTITNPNNRFCTVVCDGDNNLVSFYVDETLIGTSARSYPSGMTQMDVFSGWNGDARLNGRMRLFGVLGRLIMPEELTMMYNRSVHLSTVGEGLPV